MPKIDVSFILLSVLCLIFGIVMGIVMGAAHDFQFTPVHAHLNLLGWVSLALFGLIYKAYPASRAPGSRTPT
jgi:cbb3-type cytochrome oxidase subunit 1